MEYTRYMWLVNLKYTYLSLYTRSMTTKFQRLHPHFCGRATRRNNLNTLRRRESGKLKMAANAGSIYEITQYLSFYARYQWNVKGFTSHIFGIQQHGRNNVNILRRRGRGKLKMADITGSTFFDLPLTLTSESVHSIVLPCCRCTSKMWMTRLEFRCYI